VVGVYPGPSLGITAALGPTREGKLALWQVIARVIDQGSRLSAVRLAGTHAALSCWSWTLHEEHLYANLDWLQAQQVVIEQKLFHRLHRDSRRSCSCTMSPAVIWKVNTINWRFWLQSGWEKRQTADCDWAVCDDQGTALSIEVFQGNTADPQTLVRRSQSGAAVWRRRVTFVGDRE